MPGVVAHGCVAGIAGHGSVTWSGGAGLLASVDISPAPNLHLAMQLLMGFIREKLFTHISYYIPFSRH